ncbi:MAG: hypothetical protein LBL46_00190 [Rickettsiales bacterium]|jgi:hypothetical protein|nr:hypothetical protein [Rickettsiales bacterium]
MKKRLFIFAGYDAEGRVQDYVVRYASALGALGDVIFYMDNDAAAGELDKIRAVPGVIFAGAERHKEYDFGSYKRGYQYARCGNSYPCGGG